MTIPERVKDILEEIANKNRCPNDPMPDDAYGWECCCSSCLTTEALKLILETDNEGGEKKFPPIPKNPYRTGCVLYHPDDEEKVKEILRNGHEEIPPEDPPGISLEDFSIRYTLADSPWQWVESMCEKMYKEAFVHGFKHGVEHKNPSRNEKWDDEHISEM